MCNNLFDAVVSAPNLNRNACFLHFLQHPLHSFAQDLVHEVNVSPAPTNFPPKMGLPQMKHHIEQQSGVIMTTLIRCS
jgi:hypothetical protein